MNNRCGVYRVIDSYPTTIDRHSMQEHLYRFKRPNEFKSIIYQHLKKHNHPIKYLTVQPLEVVNKQQCESHSKFVRLRKIIE